MDLFQSSLPSVGESESEGESLLPVIASPSASRSNLKSKSHHDCSEAPLNIFKSSSLPIP